MQPRPVRTSRMTPSSVSPRRAGCWATGTPPFSTLQEDPMFYDMFVICLIALAILALVWAYGDDD
jgi:hypothetical protein